MLFRKYIVSTRVLFQLIAAVVFVAVGVGTAVAANPPIAPLLVPYEINTIAGTPQYNPGTTTIPVGYYGEGIPATPYLDAKGVQQGAVLSGPFTQAIDSVGNVYITDSGNAIIREINAQTGTITTIGGTYPKGCTGNTCTLHYQKGCDDGVLAYGSQIGSNHLDGIAVDAYGNVYFDDNTQQSVSVIYRGGAQVANFIKLVNPAGVAKAGGVLPGYVYHVAGTVDLTACTGSSGNTDNAMAFQDNSNPPTGTGYPAAQLHGPGLLHLDSAGNIYIADTSNATVRVINTQATDQTFFQYTVHPGYMRSITNCGALTTGCPTGTITGTANNGINGPVNAVVFQSQYKEAEVDAFGNIYQMNGTGSGTGPPGIYVAVAYAGGAPLTNLLVAETPTLASTYPTPPELNASSLPTYGNSYIGIGDPALPAGSLNTYVTVMAVTNEGAFNVRPGFLYPDNFGTLWYYDTHYPEFNRIDQNTSLATLFLKTGRATASVTGIYSAPASFTNPWYCVYGSASSSNPQPWTQGPQSYDPQGDGCPTNLATFSGGSGAAGDSLGNLIVNDGNENLVREISVGTTFPPTQVGTFTGVATAEHLLTQQYPGYVPTGSVVQPIQVHFSSTNPPAVSGTTIPDGAPTGKTTTAFSIPAGNIPDFTIDTTDPEFPFGSVWGSGPYTQYAKSTNFAMWAGLPTCTQLGQYPNNLPVTDYDCLAYVKFTPTVPGARQSNLLVTTASGLRYSFPLYGVGVGGQLAIDGGAPTVVPATGLGTTAGIAVAQSGIVYIADPTNNRIVVESGGTQTNLTITGVTPATLSGPMGVAVDSAANVYVSDTGNNRVLKVNPLTGVATVLGNYVWVPGSICDGGSSTSNATCPTVGLAKEPGAVVTPTTAPPQYAFNAPQGLAVDSWNNVYVADTGNSAIVEIPANIALGGAVPLQAYAGAPQFKNPIAVAVDSLGNIFVADTGLAGAIVELPPGGGDLVNVPGSSFNKVGTSGGVSSPSGIAVDAAGNLYVSDSSKNQVVEIPAVAGVGGDPFALNFTRVDSSGNVMSLNAPAGLALDANGNLYVADSGNKQVMFDNRQNPLVNFGNVPQDQTTAAQPVCQNTNISDGFNVGNQGGVCHLTVTNIGNQPISVPSPITSLVGTGNAAFSVSETCTSLFKGTIPAGLTCAISPTFMPTADNGQSETVNVNGGSQTIALAANGVGAQPLVNIVLSAAYTGGTSTTTPTTGATATITATVTQPHIAGNVPTGPVVFTYKILGDGTTGTQTVSLSGGKASFALPTLLQGRLYTINANYTPGDSLNSATVASPLVLYVPGVPVTVTAASVSFTYGTTPPAIVGTVTGILDPLVTYKFTSAAGACTPIGVYPVTVVFSGGSYLNYGFPPSLTAGGAPATVTETAAPLTYTLPPFTAQYGAANLNYSAGVVPVGTACSDLFNETFTPAQSSLLNVGTYTVVPTVTGPKAGNYTVTAPPSTLTITKAPVLISVTANQTAVLNTAAGVASAGYQISVGSTVPAGKGTPSGTVTITDAFTPITSTGYGTPGTPATIVVPLVAGFGTYTPTDPTAGIHQYSYAYSGDANFQTASLVPVVGSPACIPSAITANCLIVDNPDFTLTSPTGPIIVIPGIVPSGNGLLAVPGQSSGTPETAVLFVNKVLGFVGQVSLACQTQNPKYVSCFMTPLNVCFATSSSTACTNTTATAATVLAVQTPATLPLGFQFSSNARPGMSATKTVLAFLPFGFLAFCVRRRRRLTKALWMLIGIVAVGAGISGCGGNQVSFYTPIPTGPQTVTVTASYLGNGGSQPAATRTFVVPINID